MRDKVVFFFNYMDDRYDKRVKEFVSEGYDVEVYAFMHLDDTADKYSGYPIHTLKYYPELPSYRQRIREFTPAFRKIIRNYDPKTTLFYFFSLNTAFTTLFCKGIKYIYEESDMLFDRTKNKVLRHIIKSLNKHIIKQSAQTVFTSEGFSAYYFGNSIPSNITIIPNKVSPACLDLPKYQRRPIDFNHIRFGFVGGARYMALYNFAKNLITLYPQHEFHFYGSVNAYSEEQVRALEAVGNITFHGKFKAPVDFPAIYGNIDFVVSTYDTAEINPKYAEPNKLYESMFFGVPIIVSSNSFLADKVAKFGIGFDVDPYDVVDIKKKIDAITPETYQKYWNAVTAIPKSESVNSNKVFFETIRKIINK